MFSESATIDDEASFTGDSEAVFSPDSSGVDHGAEFINSIPEQAEQTEPSAVEASPDQVEAQVDPNPKEEKTILASLDPDTKKIMIGGSELGLGSQDDGWPDLIGQLTALLESDTPGELTFEFEESIASFETDGKGNIIAMSLELKEVEKEQTENEAMSEIIAPPKMAAEINIPEADELFDNVPEVTGISIRQRALTATAQNAASVAQKINKAIARQQEPVKITKTFSVFSETKPTSKPEQRTEVSYVPAPTVKTASTSRRIEQQSVASRDVRDARRSEPKNQNDAEQPSLNTRSQTEQAAPAISIVDKTVGDQEQAEPAHDVASSKTTSKNIARAIPDSPVAMSHEPITDKPQSVASTKPTQTKAPEAKPSTLFAQTANESFAPQSADSSPDNTPGHDYNNLPEPSYYAREQFSLPNSSEIQLIPVVEPPKTDSAKPSTSMQSTDKMERYSLDNAKDDDSSPSDDPHSQSQRVVFHETAQLFQENDPIPEPTNNEPTTPVTTQEARYDQKISDERVVADKPPKVPDDKPNSRTASLKPVTRRIEIKPIEQSAAAVPAAKQESKKPTVSSFAALLKRPAIKQIKYQQPAQSIVKPTAPVRKTYASSKQQENMLDERTREFVAQAVNQINRTVAPKRINLAELRPYRTSAAAPMADQQTEEQFIPQQSRTTRAAAPLAR